MKVSVVGMGYVGLVTGVCLADTGHDVACVDVDEVKVRLVSNGHAPIHEAGLEELLQRNLERSFRATTSLRDAVLASDLTLIAVGTPLTDDEIDLSAIRAATREVGEALRDKAGYHVVAVKSTVVPGTTDEVVLPLLEEASGKRAGVDFGVGMNPEFLTEGQAVEDFMNPDRIVVGGVDERTVDTLEELYSGFPEVVMVRTNNATAEMIKYASNALLATAISFANEIADLCASVGEVDVVDVMRAVHLSRYLSVDGRDGSRVMAPITSFLEAGCGFGGSCLPKDVRALIAHGEHAGRPMRLLKAVIGINEERPDEVLSLLRKHLPSLDGARIAILGLSFKPETDDVRESPAIPVVSRLVAEGATVRIHDPVVTRLPESLAGSPSVELHTDLAEAVCDADAAVLITRWAQYSELPELLETLGVEPVIVDGRRMLDKHRFAKYEGIGFASSRPRREGGGIEPVVRPARPTPG
ncbi:MAG: UDP-glucose dehydrogenase family protein [Gaiellaceae bacterium]